MAYDEELAARIREAIGAPYEEKRMFGGLAFMVNTHMACGCAGDRLLVRVGRDGHDDALARGAEVMEMTGRPMRGFVTVPRDDLADDDVLAAWVGEGVDHAASLPPKDAG